MICGFAKMISTEYDSFSLIDASEEEEEDAIAVRKLKQ